MTESQLVEVLEGYGKQLDALQGSVIALATVLAVNTGNERRQLLAAMHDRPEAMAKALESAGLSGPRSAQASEGFRWTMGLIQAGEDHLVGPDSAE